MTIHKIYALILGNIASSLWFSPGLAKLLHKIRGVRFKNRKSVFLGRGVIIDNRYPELVSIGEDVWLTASVVILTHSFSSKLQRKLFGLEEATGRVSIGDGVFVGAGAIICPGVKISENSYIAAGSVITKNVPANVVVAGNPSKVIKTLSYKIDKN